tara:strand:+ start:22617 stop:22823 length:207 start_codon:yes stop_codon:yes gene_type:complete
MCLKSFPLKKAVEQLVKHSEDYAESLPDSQTKSDIEEAIRVVGYELLHVGNKVSDISFVGHDDLEESD